MNLKDRLKTLRTTAGLSQKEIATKLGYTTPQFISNWERGISFPPASDLAKLVGILKADPTEISHLYVEEKCAIYRDNLMKEIHKNAN